VGVPLLDALIREEFPHTGVQNLSQKTRDHAAAQSEDFVIPACTVLIGLMGVGDTQTDRQTDA